MDWDETSMAIQLICPSLKCRKLLTVPDDVRGKMVKCQYCQTTFRVPDGKKHLVEAACAKTDK
jgi:LSD1 subclass zinc finger protein